MDCRQQNTYFGPCLFNVLKSSGSLRTTRFTIQKFYAVLALRWMFVQTSEQRATFALYIINWLVIITLLESVYCSVRTDSLHNTDYVESLKD